jgi:hypothetical protein
MMTLVFFGRKLSSTYSAYIKKETEISPCACSCEKKTLTITSSYFRNYMVHHAFVFRIMYFELRKTFLATFLSSSLAYSSIERLLQTQEAKLHSQLEAFTVANLRLKLKCIISSSIV